MKRKPMLLSEIEKNVECGIRVPTKNLEAALDALGEMRERAELSEDEAKVIELTTRIETLKLGFRKCSKTEILKEIEDIKNFAMLHRSAGNVEVSEKYELRLERLDKVLHNAML